MTYSSEVLADTPLAYWKLDEASGAPQDSSGNSLPLSVGGTLTYSQPGPIGTGTAITFPGTTGNYAGRASAFFGTRTAFSVECWVKYGTTADQVFTSLDDASTGPGATTRVWSLGIAGAHVSFLVLTAAGNYKYILNPVDNADSAWHHVVGTYNSGTMILYVDGVQVATDSVVGTLQNGGGQWVLVGAGRTGGSDGTLAPLAGSLDEVAIYGTALSPTRVAAHYTAVTNARVENLYVETLISTTPRAQVENLYSEVLFSSNPVANVETLYTEVLVNVPAVSALSPLATPSASSTGAGTAVANALDGDLSTFWKSNGTVTNETITQVFSVAQEVRSYVLGATDTISQAPKTWKLQGSHNGSSWTDVDTQTNAPAWSARATREYALAAGYTFEQWRIIWTSSQSDATAVGLSEWQLFPPLSGPATGSPALGVGALPV